jgi:predicted aspartyl protease
MANGQRVTRSVGFAIVPLDKFFTIDEVVFAEKGDLLLLGARTLEGLNLTVDPKRKRLVATGPLPAAAMRTFTG